MKDIKLASTHKHLTLVFTGVVFIIVIILGVTFLSTKYYHEGRQEKKQFLSEVAGMTSLMKNEDDFLQSFSDLKAFRKERKFNEIGKNRQSTQGPNDVSFIILDEEKNIIFQNILRQPHFDRLDLSQQTYYVDDNTYVAVRNILENKALFYKQRKYSLEDAFEDIGLLFILALISGGLFYFTGYRFVGRALAPVEENLQDMKDFIHNAGHELKTPLAVMRGNIQVMQAEKNFDKKLLSSSIRQIDTTNDLIEGLIELSEVGQLGEKESLALAIEITQAVKQLSQLAQEKHVSIINTVKGPFIVKSHRQELDILLMNLLKNAIIYNKKGGEVILSLDKNILSIKDTGKGIPKKETEKIFERFYQGSTARSKGGFGIGLSLVKKIADANGWKIQVESEKGEGTCFEIVF